MSQKYTEVEWTDETSTEPGTLINKARLDQMQSAHHYADGFEEVDTIPTADPGVDYHKVVFCTADTTFYRWDGSQWTKDIDDETKALLLAHEADHANPHQVTKAQVGLGDVIDKGMDDAPTDSSDNYVKSGGVKTALDGKLDIIPTTSGTYFYAQQSTGPTRYPGSTNETTPTLNVVLRGADGRISCTDPVGGNNAANKNYVDGKLTDGSVTKVGTANVGSDLKPIKLVAGVPTAVANDLVDTATAQTIAGVKTFTDDPVIQDSIIPRLAIRNTGDVRGTAPASTKFSGVEFRDKNDAVGGQVSTIHDATGLRKTFLEAIGQDGSTAQLGLYNEADGTKYMAGPARTYDPSNTSDIVTIGSLQASTDVVHPLSTVGKYAYTHDGSTQGETALVDGTTANTIPIRDGDGRAQAADPANGATDKTLTTANWVSQTGDSSPNNLLHRSGVESKNGTLKLTAYESLIFEAISGNAPALAGNTSATQRILDQYINSGKDGAGVWMVRNTIYQGANNKGYSRILYLRRLDANDNLMQCSFTFSIDANGKAHITANDSDGTAHTIL